MKVPFNSTSGLIVVEVELAGPTGIKLVSLAVDTGAMRTLINDQTLRFLGYDPATATSHVNMTSASGLTVVPVMVVDRLKTLGTERKRMPVIAHTLPPTATVDGLLGLDFFRATLLTLDFQAGFIEVN